MASASRFDEHVQNELCARVAQLDRDLRLLSVNELCRRAEAIRLIAEAHDQPAAGQVATDLRQDLESEGRRLAIRPYLDRMCDALGCGRQQAAAAHRFLSPTTPPRLAR